MYDSIKTLSIHSLLKQARGVVAAGMLAATLMVAGCADAQAQSMQTVQATQPAARPDLIYVYAFNSDASDVKLDQHGIASRLMSDASAQEAQQTQDALMAREAVANEIVARLQAQGLRAIRADVPPLDDRNVLAVTGDFSTIDAGNRRRRVLIGLGAGESKVGATVQLVYKPAHGVPQVIEQFDAKGDSGHAPGVAEMAGVGAAAGHVASSLAVSGGMHAVSEKKHADVSSDEKRLGDAIAKEIAKVSQREGWTTVKG